MKVCCNHGGGVNRFPPPFLRIKGDAKSDTTAFGSNIAMNERKQIIIVGLRRSGTTVFWRIFRQDPRFLCFDEPFNPILMDLPRNGAKGTRDEFIEIFRNDPDLFWRKFREISPLEELHHKFTSQQAEYLKWLSEMKANVVLDTTRCYRKLADLREILPEAYIIHLHRCPSAWAYSHLIPSEAGSALYRIRHIYRKMRLFDIKYGFRNWSIENILGKHTDSLFFRTYERDRERAVNVLSANAIGKLLYFWDKVFYDVEEQGKKYWGDRFYSLSYEEFASNPRETMRFLYNWVGIDFQECDTEKVNPPKPPKLYFPAKINTADKWKQAAKSVGVPCDVGYLFRK